MGPITEDGGHLKNKEVCHVGRLKESLLRERRKREQIARAGNRLNARPSSLPRSKSL